MFAEKDGIILPKPEEDEVLMGLRDDINAYLLFGDGIGNDDLMIVYRDLTIPINVTIEAETENIIKGLGIRDLEGAEEGSLLIYGIHKSMERYFIGGGMDPFSVVILDEVLEDGSHAIERTNLVPSRCPDESILHPTIRTFYLTFSLRREGVGHLGATLIQNLFPLRRSIIGVLIESVPRGLMVSFADEPEDGVLIGIILEGSAISGDD